MDLEDMNCEIKQKELELMMNPIVKKFPFDEVKWAWCTLNAILELNLEKFIKRYETKPLRLLYKVYKKLGIRQIFLFLNDCEKIIIENQSNNEKNTSNIKNKRLKCSSVVKISHKQLKDDDYDERDMEFGMSINNIGKTENNNNDINEYFNKSKITIIEFLNCSFFNDLPFDTKIETVELIDAFNKGVKVVNKIMDYCDKKLSSIAEITLKKYNKKKREKKNVTKNKN